ncbi:transcriptional repressor LexA [Clostridium cellulovorans]|uniref:LexA repressor n=1 Tax=Clostridium cellulovorans (strain ATCC 35296 / DSM 3052 / OCM 3 / 743B) TaxID=573061 RepID=D9SM49_CLOC7|nr:transcriptional repressor LexA [Clostridium cellulovorans]ADL51780.1 transcriptional repressor, LexA family [Clostridium cellulovorans 743B]
MVEKNNKQMEIYNYIKSVSAERGYPPSVREICTAVGLSSTSTVHGHLERLEKRGYIRRDPSKPRAIELLKENKVEMLSIPIIGKVTAGNPILAFEDIEDTFTIPSQFIKSNKELFMLKVSGESMVEAGIRDGDLAIIEKQNTANNGDIVVAMIEGEATIKTFYREENHIRLQPENKLLSPIIVNSCTILGKLAGIFRNYK